MGIPCSLDPLGSSLSIAPGKVLVDSRTYGQIPIELPVNGIYRIYLTAAGGYGGWRANSLSACGGGGGSGMHLEFDVLLNKGVYYYSAGKSFQDHTAGAVFYQVLPYSNDTTIGATQGGGHSVNREPGGGGTGWIARDQLGYLNVLSQVNGNAGTRGASTSSYGVGGASLDADGISGRGGDGTCRSGTTIGVNPGQNGRVKVTYIGQYGFTPGQVVIEKVSSAAIKSINLLRGRYRVELVGGGGGQGGFATNNGVAFNSGGGGSGSAFVGIMNVTAESQMFDIYAGHVGSTNRGYVGSGGDGTNSWISEQGNLDIRLYCNSAGTGSGGWSGHGTGGTIVNNGSFKEKYFTSVEFQSNGNAGEDGSKVGRWGHGGKSVYQGFGTGAGDDTGDGTAGLVRITYLGV